MAKPACEEQLPRIEMAGDGFLRRTSFRVQSDTASAEEELQINDRCRLLHRLQHTPYS